MIVRPKRLLCRFAYTGISKMVHIMKIFRIFFRAPESSAEPEQNLSIPGCILSNLPYFYKNSAMSIKEILYNFICWSLKN